METSLDRATAKLSEISEPVIQSVYGNKLRKLRGRVDQLVKSIGGYFKALTELSILMERFEQQCQGLRELNRAAEAALDEILRCKFGSSLQHAQNNLQVGLLISFDVLACAAIY